MSIMIKFLLFIAGVILATSCTSQIQQQSSRKGFLTMQELPNAVKFLPAPPKSGAAYDEDVKYYEWGKEQRKDPKISANCLRQDTMDVTTIFNEALGFKLLSYQNKEILDLVSWAVKDARKVSNPAKEYYKRLKPFQVFHEASLKDNAKSAMSSSTFAYPSGHAVRSWTYAFVLADVAPEYTKVLNKCADDYSMGRVIMGRHWKTDIDAGKMVAAKVYEKLKKSPAYQAQLKLAREQYKTVQKQ